MMDDSAPAPGAATVGIDAMEQLRAHLTLPVSTVGPAEPRSPEMDIIDAIERRGRPPGKMEELATVADDLLASCQDRIAAGERSPELVALVGRLGFLCSSLSLRVDAARFFLIAVDIRLSSACGRPVDPDALFLILRAVGRLEAPSVATEIKQLFWSTLLKAPHKGTRTLAAQNLIRLDPDRELLRLRTTFAADVNEPLVAHELVLRLGRVDLLADLAVRHLPHEVVERLRGALAEVGQFDAAQAIDNARGGIPGKDAADESFSDLLRRFGVVGDASGALIDLLSGAADPGRVDAGLQASRRSGTVVRFMSNGGASVAAAELRRFEASRGDLRLPTFAGA